MVNLNGWTNFCHFETGEETNERSDWLTDWLDCTTLTLILGPPTHPPTHLIGKWEMYSHNILWTQLTVCHLRASRTYPHTGTYRIYFREIQGVLSPPSPLSNWFSLSLIWSPPPQNFGTRHLPPSWVKSWNQHCAYIVHVHVLWKDVGM